MLTAPGVASRSGGCCLPGLRSLRFKRPPGAGNAATMEDRRLGCGGSGGGGCVWLTEAMLSGDVAKGRDGMTDRFLEVARAERLRLAKAGTDYSEKPAGTLRLASFNVHMLSGYAEGTGVVQMRETIERLDADVLVLEEMLPNDMERFVGDLYEFTHLQLTQDWFGNAICSKLPLKDVGSLQYEAGKKGEPRNAVYGVVEVAGVSVRVVGTHLDVWDPSGQTRLSQATELQQLASAAAEDNTIVLGDFNALRREHYCDAHWEWIERQDEERHHFFTPAMELDPFVHAGFRDVLSDFDAPCVSTWSLRRVDYAWKKPTWNLPIAQAFVDMSAASDHLPIVVDVQMLAAS